MYEQRIKQFNDKEEHVLKNSGKIHKSYNNTNYFFENQEQIAKNYINKHKIKNNNFFNFILISTIFFKNSQYY
jgi:hypothetical protein